MTQAICTPFTVLGITRSSLGCGSHVLGSAKSMRTCPRCVVKDGVEDLQTRIGSAATYQFDTT
jgi:hypothetical protein